MKSWIFFPLLPILSLIFLLFVAPFIWTGIEQRGDYWALQTESNTDNRTVFQGIRLGSMGIGSGLTAFRTKAGNWIVYGRAINCYKLSIVTPELQVTNVAGGSHFYYTESNLFSRLADLDPVFKPLYEKRCIDLIKHVVIK